MKGNRHPYSRLQATSSFFMMLALLWLTVSIPFVNAAKDALQASQPTAQCEDTNPFATTTEEKNESSVNNLSEYLHDLQPMDNDFISLTKYYKCHPSDLYFEFHPELISPPPEV